MNTTVDSRREALLSWANGVLDCTPAWAPASADASFRRYFRGTAGERRGTAGRRRGTAGRRRGTAGGRRGVADARSWIAMDAPPEHEDNAAFVRIADLLSAAGLNAPRVLAHDVQRGFLLLSDLGRETYLDVLDADNADRLFSAAIGALIDLQAASRPGVLPDYDRATLAAELELFRQWYVPHHLRHALTSADNAGIDAAFAFLLDQVLAQPRVFVHRDYMPRNLMVSQPLPGVLDFQDARYGPVTYDIACLFKDAFISWPEQRVTGWLRDYWRRAQAVGVPVDADFARFSRQVELMGAQRHLKVLGIFARIAHRDGKPRYLTDAARFVAYLAPVVARHPELAPLGPLLAMQAPA